MIYLGGKEVKEIYLGGKRVEAIYLGNKLVFHGKTLHIPLRQMMLDLNEDDQVCTLVTFDQNLGACELVALFTGNDNAKIMLTFADTNCVIGTVDMRDVDAVSVCKLNTLDTDIQGGADITELSECLAVHIVVEKAELSAKIDITEVCGVRATLEQIGDIKSVKPINLTEKSQIAAGLLLVTTVEPYDNISISENEKSSAVLLVVESVDTIDSIRLLDNSNIKGMLVKISPESISGVWQTICEEAAKSAVLSVDSHSIETQAIFSANEDIGGSRLSIQPKSVSAESTFLSREEPYVTCIKPKKEQITANAEFSADVFQKICLLMPCLLPMTFSTEMKCDEKIGVQATYAVHPALSANIGILCASSAIVDVVDVVSEDWEYPKYSEGKLKITQVRSTELDGHALKITDMEE